MKTESPDSTQSDNKKDKDDKKDKRLDVKVFAPDDPEEFKTFSWDKHMLVADAAEEAAAAFGLPAGSHTLEKDGTALDRNKPLVAVGVRDGDELGLVDMGGGV